MSRAIEAAALFAVGCIAGGAIVYSTRRTASAPPPPQQPSTAPPPALRERDILVAEPVRQGLYFSTKVANGRISKIASLWESRTDSRYWQSPCICLLLRSTDEKSSLGCFPFTHFVEETWFTDGKVVEDITKEKLEKRIGDRTNSLFLEDPAIPEKFRAKLSDYFRSGYDRGHQVPFRKHAKQIINFRSPRQMPGSLKQP